MKKIYNILFIALIVFSSLAYLELMFNGAVWYDEAYSMAMVKHSFLDICKITAQDVHPPMYYFLLKLAVAPFNYSLFSAKIFSALPILLTMILGYVKLAKNINHKTGFLFALMMAFLPIMTMFSVEIRMYAWSALFVTGCGIYAYEASKAHKPIKFVFFTFFGIMSAYTHYFALVSAGIIYVILFISCIKQKRFKGFIISAACTLILYLPWLTSFITQLADKVENEYWIAPITLETVLNYFKVWFKCGNYTEIYLIGIGILAVGAIISLIKIKDKNLKYTALYCALVFILTNIIGIIASIIVRPVFIERYAVPALPLVLMALAIGIAAFDKKSIYIITAVFFTVGFCINYPYEAQKEYEASELEIRDILDDAQYEALICYVDSHLYGVLSYYSENTPVYRPKLSKGSPFDNIYALSDFDSEACKWAAIFVPKGNEIPYEMTDKFNVDYIRTVSTYGIECDMYNLWK